MDDEKICTPGILPNYPMTHSETNYKHFFAVDVGGVEGNDQYVYLHANGLCIIGMASKHSIFLKSQKIKSVDFDLGKKNRTVQVSGKRKKNAKLMDSMSILCKVYTEDDSCYAMRSCVKGGLLELNYALSQNSSLLQSKSNSDGFMGIIMPKPHDLKNSLQNLISKEEYYALRH